MKYRSAVLIGNNDTVRELATKLMSDFTIVHYIDSVNQAEKSLATNTDLFGCMVLFIADDLTAPKARDLANLLINTRKIDSSRQCRIIIIGTADKLPEDLTSCTLVPLPLSAERILAIIRGVMAPR